MKKVNKFKNIGIFLSILFGFLSISTDVRSMQQDPEEIILGIWIPEGLSIGNRWEFDTNGKLKKYLNNNLDEVYNWYILSSSLVCEESVPVGSNFLYLKLVNQANNDIFCYEFTSLDNDLMQLRFFGNGGFNSYLRP